MIACPQTYRPTKHIDFFGHQISNPLPRIETVRQDLQPIQKLVTLYTEVLDRNGSVAKHLHMPLFSSRIEDRINALFSSSRPRMVDVASADNHRRPRLSWVDVIRESETIDQIDFEEDQCRFCIHGVSIDVNKSDRDLLSSNVLQKLLQAPPEPEDIQAEWGARKDLVGDLIELREDIQEIDRMIETMLQALQEQPHNANRECIGSVTPEASFDIQMWDAGEEADPVVHNETMINDENSNDHCPDGRNSTSLAAQNTPSANNLQASVKSMSPWSHSEKRQLRSFLSTRGHLSWSRIALEYEEEFHKGRSPSSISGQARCLGLSVGRKSNKKPARRDPLVLKVRVPPTGRSSSSEEITSAGPDLTETCVGDETPIASSARSHSLQDRPNSAMECHTTSPCGSSNPPFILQSNAKKNHTDLRHSDPETPKSFASILN
ncbi:hypothetical protein N7513_003560 [Penicillium frequentans]|nr:hypothetical protein N7513_004720 [Penicillium glabrum]KAJ5555918.1 hypothetical protein N7513_003560 [Penicillium glabrum]